jgi:hypothetical protein
MVGCDRFPGTGLSMANSLCGMPDIVTIMKITDDAHRVQNHKSSLILGLMLWYMLA